MPKKIKLYYFAPHPVQYHVGIYKELAKIDRLDFKVIYQDDFGLKPTYVAEFKSDIAWDIDLLKDYPSEFMKNYGNRGRGGVFARVNIGIFSRVLVEKPDVILFKGYTTASDWLLMILSLVSKTKIIFRGEAILNKHQDPDSFKQMMKKFVITKWLSLCDAVMFSCAGNKEYFKYFGVPETKLFPIPCAVDNEFFRGYERLYRAEKGAIRAAVGIPEDNLVVLFSARFTIRKRPMDLLTAISKIDNANITVLFVGDGPEKDIIKDFAKNNGIHTVFTGFVNQTEISKYYSVADLGTVISDYDPSPKAMNEAMNFRLPIIVSDAVGTAFDLVKDGHNGFIVEVGDIDAIASKIDFFNKNRGEMMRMGENSFDCVEKWNFVEDVKGIEQAIIHITADK